VELVQGISDLQTNVTNDNEMITGKIALAHLNEFPDYYTRLEKMEKVAKEFHNKNQKKGLRTRTVLTRRYIGMR
jgi:hypothetical protein